jgi:hypothetical protein
LQRNAALEPPRAGRAAAKRAMDAMMTMKKIDIAKIEAAGAGAAHAVR